MLSTSARLLRLLGLLQSRRDWTGPELADRLDVTTRTVRTDVDRLRRLGYPVDAAPGVAGGYRLGIGAALPPLLLDDEEAVAVALGPACGRVDSVTGIEESSQRALIKLEHVLPEPPAAPAADPAGRHGPDRGTRANGARRGRHRPGLRLPETTSGCGSTTASYDGPPSFRVVEPHRLVHARQRWYLVAWDLDARRMAHLPRRSHRAHGRTRVRVFAPREPPDGDLVAWITDRLATRRRGSSARGCACTPPPRRSPSAARPAPA